MVKKYNSSNNNNSINNKSKQKYTKRDPNIIYNDSKNIKSTKASSPPSATIPQNECNDIINNNINSTNPNLSQMFKGNNLVSYLNKIMQDEKSYKDLLEECRSQAAEIGLDPKIFTGILNNTNSNEFKKNEQ